MVSHDTGGETPRRFGTFLYLPSEGPPGAWSVDGFRLRDLNTVTIGDLPARFDWSIMGWTILLLALMNLQKMKRGREGGREGRGKGGKREEEEEGDRNIVSVYLETRSGKNC